MDEIERRFAIFIKHAENNSVRVELIKLRQLVRNELNVPLKGSGDGN